MSEETTGAIGGALTGAAEGAAIGSVIPGVGTIIGGVAGAIIGGIFGMGSGKAKRQARLKAQQINNITRAQMEQEQAIQRRDIIRGSRINYAHSLASSTAAEGEVSSTGLKGVEGSNLSQNKFNIDFLQMQSQQALNKFNLTGQMEHYQQQGQTYDSYLNMAVGAARIGSAMYRPGANTTGTYTPEVIKDAPDPFSTGAVTGSHGWGSAPNQSLGQYGSFTIQNPGGIGGG